MGGVAIRRFRVVRKARVHHFTLHTAHRPQGDKKGKMARPSEK
jgi:hypothetical protein